MMKINIFKIVLIFSVAVFFNSCDEEQIIYNPPSEGFAQIMSTTGEIVENAEGNIVTTIQLGRPNTSGVTVNFTITSSDPSRFNVISGSETTMTIPQGETSGEIVIDPIDNFDIDGNAEVTITLTGDSVGIGGEGLELTTRTITIIDNDCELDLSEFVGTYDLTLSSDPDDAFTAEVSLGSTPNTLVVDNWWRRGLVAEITFDNSDLTNPRAFVMPQNTEVELCCGLPAFITSRPDDNAPGAAGPTAGLPDGTFSTCNLTFSLDVFVYVPTLGTFNGATEITHIFTKQ